MKKFTFFLLLIISPLLIIASYSKSANASAISDFYGEIYWDTFNFGGIEGLSVVSNSEMNQINYWAQAQGGTPDDQNNLTYWDDNEWQNERSRTGSLGDSFGNVSWEQMLSADDMYSSGSAYANGTTQNYVSNSKAERAINITLSGSGTFTAEADFFYSYFLNNGLIGDSSNGQVWMQLRLSYWDNQNNNEYTYFNDQVIFTDYISNGIGTESAEDTGTLSLALDFNFTDRESQNAQLWIMTMAQASTSSVERIQTDQPVPIPSTIFLFGLGLLGLAGVSRRKK